MLDPDTGALREDRPPRGRPPDFIHDIHIIHKARQAFCALRDSHSMTASVL